MDKVQEINIIVKTDDGLEDHIKIASDTLVEKAKNMMLEHFKIVPDSDDKYKLVVKDRTERKLDDSKTLADEGVKDNMTLWLETEQHVGSNRTNPCSWQSCRGTFFSFINMQIPSRVDQRRGL